MSGQPDDLFLVLSLKWAGGEKITWWGPDNAGYTPDFERAGRYTRAIIEGAPSYYNDGINTLAIPLVAAERFVAVHTFVPRRRAIMQTLRRYRSRAGLTKAPSRKAILAAFEGVATTPASVGEGEADRTQGKQP